jgi:hypothetical protein
VWRGGILWNLHSMGFRGQLPLFLQGLLSNRTFQVRLGSNLSQRFDLVQGVPQGSVLSPLCFALAIDGITDCLPHNVHSSLYVDDLAIYYQGSRLANLERVVQTAINNLVQWAKKKGFRFSSTKTKAMLFHSHYKKDMQPMLKLGDAQLPLVDSVRFLGLHFDPGLRWGAHVRALVGSCRRIVELLRHISRVRSGVDRATLHKFTTALLSSRLAYGAHVYGSASYTVLKPLYPLLNEALRRVTGAFHTTRTESIYVEANTLPLDFAHKLEMIKTFLRLPLHFQTAAEPLFDDAQTPERAWPYSVVIAGAIEGARVGKLQILPFDYQTARPWIVPPVRPCFALKGRSKRDSPPSVLRAAFQEHSNCHQNSSMPTIAIYTDGSRAAGGGGGGCLLCGVHGLRSPAT